MKKVLLLGATGLLGQHVLRALLAQHYHVVALHRQALPPAMPDVSALDNLCWQQGNLLQPSHLLQVAEGCDAIINCAGTTNMALRHYADYLPVNRDLCAYLIEVMQHTGIQCLVHVSTANTIGCGSPTRPATEEAPPTSPFADSYYTRSKQEGENLLLQYAQGHPEGHVVIVNPGFLLGAYDLHHGSGRMLTAAYRKPLMLCPKGGKSFVSAASAAAAIVQALTQGCNGQRYLLTGENLTLRELYTLQAHTLHYRQWLLPLPNGLAMVAARVGDLLRRCGVTTQLCTMNVRQLLVCEYYRHDKAAQALHFAPAPVEEAIAEYFHWRASTRHPRPWDRKN